MSDAARSPDPRPRGVGGYAFLFTLVLGTGFWNLGAGPESPFFRLNLVLHPLLGVVATLTIVLALFQRLRAAVPGLGFLHLVSFVVVCFVALARAITITHLPEMRSNQLTGAMSPILVAATAYFVVRTVPLLPAIARARRGWGEPALLSLWLLAALLGVLIGTNALVHRVPRWFFGFHAAVGYAASAAGLWVLLRPALRAPRSAGLLEGVGLALLVLFGGAAAVNAVREARLPPFTVHLSVIPDAERRAEDRDPVPQPVEASWLEPTASCGGSACHQALVEEVRQSIHGTSYETAHLHLVLAGLRAELGPDAERMCAGCHVPASLLASGPPAEAYRERPQHHDELSCVFCHSVTDAQVDDAHRSHYVVSLSADAIAPFRAAERSGGGLGFAERAFIQLNPKAHGRAFSPPVLREDRFCLACHHAQMREAAPPAPDAAPEVPPNRLRCAECHMEPRTAFGHPDATRSHLFLGSNSTLPALLGRPDVAQLTERWMTSEFLVQSFADLYAAERPRLFGQERKRGYYYLEAASSLTPQPRPGAVTELRVVTRNLAMTHAFPASSLDLQEAWLEVRVTDASGAVVFTSGGVDEDQRILEGTRVLGGELLDHAGRRIERYRVWAAAREVVHRQVPPGGEIVDAFTFTVPEGAAAHLDVEARWRYRKIGQPFWQWAYSLDQPIPSPVLIRHHAQYPLAAPPSTP